MELHTPLKAFVCPHNSNARCWKPCSGRGQKARNLPLARRTALGPPLRVRRPPRNRASMPEGSGSSVASKHPADHENKAPTHRDSSSDASSRLIVPNPAERARTPSSPRSSAASPPKASSCLFLATSRFGDTGTDGQCSPDRIVAQRSRGELTQLSQGNPFNEVCPRNPKALLRRNFTQAMRTAPEAIPQRHPRGLQPREHAASSWPLARGTAIPAGFVAPWAPQRNERLRPKTIAPANSDRSSGSGHDGRLSNVHVESTAWPDWPLGMLQPPLASPATPLRLRGNSSMPKCP